MIHHLEQYKFFNAGCFFSIAEYENTQRGQENGDALLLCLLQLRFCKFFSFPFSLFLLQTCQKVILGQIRIDFELKYID